MPTAALTVGVGLLTDTVVPRLTASKYGDADLAAFAPEVPPAPSPPGVRVV